MDQYEKQYKHHALMLRAEIESRLASKGPPRSELTELSYKHPGSHMDLRNIASGEAHKVSLIASPISSASCRSASAPVLRAGQTAQEATYLRVASASFCRVDKKGPKLADCSLAGEHCLVPIIVAFITALRRNSNWDQ